MRGVVVGLVLLAGCSSPQDKFLNDCLARGDSLSSCESAWRRSDPNYEPSGEQVTVTTRAPPSNTEAVLDATTPGCREIALCQAECHGADYAACFELCAKNPDLECWVSGLDDRCRCDGAVVDAYEDGPGRRGPPPAASHAPASQPYRPSTSSGGPHCVKGKRCGNSCIARSKTCHK